MRNGQNKRMRGRNNNNRKSQNPLTRVYESNGPDLKIRGTASHIAEKYSQLARDAHTSGDPVAAENYFQHAEHYLRLIAAAQEQFRQANPYYRPENDQRDDHGDDGDDDGTDTTAVGDAPAGTGEQPFIPRESQPFPPREQNHVPREQRHQHQPGNNYPQGYQGDADRLPAFITGGQPQGQNEHYQGNRPQNGHEGQGDRYPMHRRRRRHRGPRSDMQGSPSSMGSEPQDDMNAAPPRPPGE